MKVTARVSGDHIFMQFQPQTRPFRQREIAILEFRQSGGRLVDVRFG